MASKIAIRPGMIGLVKIKAMKRMILSCFLNPVSRGTPPLFGTFDEYVAKRWLKCLMSGWP